MPKTASSSFTIFNASAGAGKTHTLVSSFLFRLLSTPYPNQIQRLLAITFTNKAAQEMKGRILERLEFFSKDLETAKNDAMFLELVERCDISSDELHIRAKRAYLYILHHFGQFNVSTIDKLTHQIIRTFARDLGINARFDVAIDGKAFMAEVVSLVLSKAGEDEALTKILVDYVLQKADALKSWDISKEVSTIAEMFINENYMQSLSALSEKPMEAFAVLDRKIADQIKMLKNPIKEKATAVLVFFRESGIDDEWFPRKTLPNLLRMLQKGEWRKEPMSKTMLKSVETGIFLKADAKKHQSLIDPLTDDIVELLRTYDRNWRQVMLLTLLRKNVVPLSLMQRIGQEVNNLQEERNMRLLGFFNKQISDSIKDTSTPFIYERMGVRYQHFFVDEFQDTSALQWANLHPLFSHALEDDQRKGSLVLVGDAKQSIYRWRGGYPEQFMKLANKEVPFSVDPVVADLPTNYRSGAEIISFNNAFFTKAAAFLPVKTQQQLYASSCNQQSNTKDGGYVTLSTIEGKNKQEQVLSYQEAVVSRVKDCKEQGYDWEDICVLVRKNEQGVQLAKALTEAGISITSSESLLIGQSPEVQFLMHLVKLRVEPNNKDSNYAVLEPFAMHHKDPFSWTLEQLSRPFGEVLDELTHGKFNLATFQQLTLYAALEYAIWAFSLSNELTAHIQAFLDEVLKLEAKKEATTTQLLAQWDQHKDYWKVSPPEGRNAVRIMTVHKAKGLAFRVVILPFADSNWTDGHAKLAWFPLPQEDYAPFEEMLLPINGRLTALGEGANEVYKTHHAQAILDTLNTLYVGMTRPVDELHIVTLPGNANEPPKGLPDVFTHLFPNLKEQMIAVGNRKTPSVKIQSNLMTTKTMWNFNSTRVISPISSGKPSSEEAQYGLLFHELMAQIEVPQDVERVLTQTKAKELLSLNAYIRLENQIKRVVNHEQLTAFFDPAHTVYCERPLLTETAEIVRPDRFVVTKSNEVLLLDYKTGTYKEDHKTQIYEYAKLLEKNMLKVKQILLVYVEKTISLKEV